LIDTARRRVAPLIGAMLLVIGLLASARSAAAEDDAAGSTELGEAPITTIGPFSYHPGRGLRVGTTGLTVGGFTNIKAEHTGKSGSDEFTVDRLNFFFIFDRFARFRAVADLQLKDIFAADEETTGTKDFAFDARRLFGDFTIYDELHVRAGTFLTPVSYWNLILATPLTFTTEIPLIVEETFFEPTTTGVMLHGSTGVGPGRFGYSLFSQFLDPLEDDPELDPPDQTAGLQVTYDTLPTWSVGAAYQASEKRDQWSHLGSVYLCWQPERAEVLAEALFQDGEDLESFQWGAYLQVAYEIYRRVYLVTRYEHFEPPESPALNVVTAGAVWKPYPFMAVKVEYRVGDHSFEDEDLDGFFVSLTTLF
jgi:hypothetical protein